MRAPRVAPPGSSPARWSPTASRSPVARWCWSRGAPESPSCCPRPCCGPTRPSRWSGGAGCGSPPSSTRRSCSGGSNDPSSSTPTSPPRSGPTPIPSTCGCVASPRADGWSCRPRSSPTARAAGELHAYRTFKAGSLAFEFRPLDADAVGPARTPWRSGKLLRWRTRHRPVWLVGERPETAQDTGVALFEYLREAHPEIDARYVITRDSPDLARVADDPNTVMFGSRRARRVGPGRATHPRVAPQRVPAAGAGAEVRAQRQGHPGLPPARGDGHQEHGRQLRLRRTGIHRRRVHRQLRARTPDDRGRLRLARPSGCSSPGLARHDRLFDREPAPRAPHPGDADLARLAEEPRRRQRQRVPRPLGGAPALLRVLGVPRGPTTWSRTSTCTRTCSPTPTCST